MPEGINSIALANEYTDQSDTQSNESRSDSDARRQKFIDNGFRIGTAAAIGIAGVHAVRETQEILNREYPVENISSAFSENQNPFDTTQVRTITNSDGTEKTITWGNTSISSINDDEYPIHDTDEAIPKPDIEPVRFESIKPDTYKFDPENTTTNQSLVDSVGQVDEESNAEEKEDEEDEILYEEKVRLSKITPLNPETAFLNVGYINIINEVNVPVNTEGKNEEEIKAAQEKLEYESISPEQLEEVISTYRELLRQYADPETDIFEGMTNEQAFVALTLGYLNRQEAQNSLYKLENGNLPQIIVADCITSDIFRNKNEIHTMKDYLEGLFPNWSSGNPDSFRYSSLAYINNMYQLYRALMDSASIFSYNNETDLMLTMQQTSDHITMAKASMRKHTLSTMENSSNHGISNFDTQYIADPELDVQKAELYQLVVSGIRKGDINASIRLPKISDLNPDGSYFYSDHIFVGGIREAKPGEIDLSIYTTDLYNDLSIMNPSTGQT